MKIKLASIVVLIMVCVSAMADQPPAVVNRYVDDFMIRMNTKTHLNDKQVQELANILYDGIEEREDIIDSYEGETSLFAKRSLKSELDAANEVVNSKAREILDEKQYVAFKEVQAENQAKLRARLTQ